MQRAVRVVLAAVLVLAAAAGVTSFRAPLLRDWREWRDASDLVPGLLQVQPGLQGAVSLGNGVYAQLTTGGLLVTRQSATVFRSVDHGAPFTAALGHLEWRSDDDTIGTGSAWPAHDGPRWHVREVVDHSLGNVVVTGRDLQESSVRYSGRVFADSPDGPLSRAFTLTVTRRARDSRVLLDVNVPGVDAVALHSFRRNGYVYRGGGAQRGELLLREGRYPILTRSTDVGADPTASLAPVPVIFSSASTGFALDSRAYAVLDLRHGGRVDATLWQSRLQARLYDGTPLQLVTQHSSDAALMPQLPVWATSGAVVSVRGGPRRVIDTALKLVDADAALAAVLVRDGGERRRYPDWHGLVDRLAAKDVRVLTAVAPSLAVAPRAGGPDDEPQLLATARARGYLVTDRSGRPISVRTPDPDVGSVRGELIDLTNPDAVRWYTGVLTERMRRERLSGWSVLGGDELPDDVRLARGDPLTEHNAWPRRWAAITRQACVQAGRPDCLLLQSTADERTPASVGSFGVGRQAADWSQGGLGGALAATVNAGISGLTITHSAVGGSREPSGWWDRGGRSDELLERWTELETFGPLLVTDDGDRPTDLPQVWDSPDRLAAFARMSRVFATLAAYRRSVVLHASRDGVPVVRPLWLTEPGLTQASTGSQFLFGDTFVVAPVLTQGQRSVDVALPAGRWVELFTGVVHDVGPARASAPGQPGSDEAPDPETTLAAPQDVRIDAPLGQPVVLYRASDREGARVRAALVASGLLPSDVPSMP
ncbi:MAG TPA: TIM-barrel domain-containing protein [Angustibacter sp.]|nr:TIM-barrel domain-containing protein [Angustibacter sp.]